MSARTISEQILSAHCGRAVTGGDIAICSVDCVVGTDGSGPMAIDYFERMAGTRLFDPARVFFSLDHYAPPTTTGTRAFHERIRTFAARTGATVFEVGEGISHQILIERGIVKAGDLVVGADSHTVTCGAANAFAIGVGSSDLAAAMMTGKIWLRVPSSIRVVLTGDRPSGVAAKDVALAIVRELGSEGANYQAIEFAGDALAQFAFDDRLVLCNLLVEGGAKTAMCPYDRITAEYHESHGGKAGTPIVPDADAHYVREIVVPLPDLTPRVARPHAPDNVGSLDDAGGVAVQMVFIGTCTGGRVCDVHDALDAFDRAGGALASGVQFVVTPASREVHEGLASDGSLDRLVAAGAVVTMAGCGACCGTSGVIPGDGMTVVSSANRNFKARMGNATAEIYLASPAVCGVAAATGRIPREQAFLQQARDTRGPR